ncbi:MAG: bifunctional 4-hydroxy-2-oxoglutarate aldolase/2-dehydro-3-deoxy-phosphogluconate aldolase [Solobacterium sp.]|nr:bifunctional 4-hydroxy-2-oxoglutarate aldolase/2-dehydro-3-deoxy-phosphogluconate aldolase [Solobacterium sp.]
MEMKQMTERLKEIGIVPVVVINEADKAEKLAEALTEGGLPCAEVTFRTECAAEAIRIMKKAYPDMLVGAGTILSTEQAEEAIRAGASFIVSPGLNPAVVRYALDRGIPFIPGVCTPSEVEMGMSFGLTTLKFFPAEAYGGIRTLKALHSPYRQISFMPTGGISVVNARDYLRTENVAFIGGSWMVKEDWISMGKFDHIREKCMEAKEIVEEVRNG